MRNIFKATAVAILCVNTINVQATPVQWTSGVGANNHWYDFIGGSNTWASAQTSALGSTFSGMTGYLATITSAEENDFLVALSSIDGWIGATDQARAARYHCLCGSVAGRIGGARVRRVECAASRGATRAQRRHRNLWPSNGRRSRLSCSRSKISLSDRLSVKIRTGR